MTPVVTTYARIEFLDEIEAPNVHAVFIRRKPLRGLKRGLIVGEFSAPTGHHKTSVKLLHVDGVRGVHAQSYRRGASLASTTIPPIFH